MARIYPFLHTDIPTFLSQIYATKRQRHSSEQVAAGVRLLDQLRSNVATGEQEQLLGDVLHRDKDGNCFIDWQYLYLWCCRVKGQLPKNALATAEFEEQCKSIFPSRVYRVALYMTQIKERREWSLPFVNQQLRMGPSLSLRLSVWDYLVTHGRLELKRTANTAELLEEMKKVAFADHNDYAVAEEEGALLLFGLWAASGSEGPICRFTRL